MKELYMAPSAELVRFASADVITGSDEYELPIAPGDGATE